MKRGTVLWLVVILVLGIGGVLAYKRVVAKRAAAAAPAPAAGKVTTAAPSVIELSPADLGVAETRAVRRELPLTGQLRPIHQASVRAKVGGDIVEMRVREGETVKAGQVLARIDPAEFQARLDERLATLAASKATWENNERTRKNNEELLRKNFISQQAYDNTLANADVARAQVKAAEANVVLARKALEDAVVLAPWAGLVSERLAQVGDKASPDMRLLTLVDLTRMDIEAAVPAGDIPEVARGQEVTLKVDGFDARVFKGRIARIAPQAAAGSRSIMVYVEIANADLTLKGGMFAKGALTLANLAAVTAVPVTALREERGETVIYALDGERLARLPVKVGARNEEEAWAEITEGVKPGTRIVKTNLGALTPGLPVKVTGAPAPPQPATGGVAAPTGARPETPSAAPSGGAAR
ncbi:MAG: efflux RND transporter periplasmic adaptor subunit [Burkholderiales bacterium]|nr:efflux RND transporter periplasmic adaptor subunit [Burkholderiales bacterium]